MITKEHIEKVAHHYSHVWDEYDAFVAGAEWALEQCPYSKEDMIDLLHFVRLSAPNWIIPDDELVKLWEEQK